MVMHVSHSFLSPPLSFQQRQNGGSPSVRNAILKQPMRRQPWRHRRTGAVHKTPPLLEKLFFWGAGAGLEESRRLSSTTTSQWRCAVQLLASRPSVETLGATSCLHSPRIFYTLLFYSAAWLGSFPTCTFLPHVSVIPVFRPTASLKPVLLNIRVKEKHTLNKLLRLLYRVFFVWLSFRPWLLRVVLDHLSVLECTVVLSNAADSIRLQIKLGLA